MAHLVIRKGTNPGHRLTLDKDTIILGRSPDCDIPIPSPSISRQHARLQRVEDKWFIEDMLSRNGTGCQQSADSCPRPAQAQRPHPHLRLRSGLSRRPARRHRFL